MGRDVLFDFHKQKEKQMASITVWLFDEEGEEEQVSLPAKMEVCGRCDGEGTHVNPAIDGNGISSEQMDEWSSPDWDFREEYMRGTYDVRCEECKGANVVPVVDEERCDPELLKRYHKHLQDEWESKAIDRAEARAFGYY